MKTHFCFAQSRIRKHLKLGLSYCLSLASVLAIATEAIAMPAQVSSTTTEPSALRLQPSYNINLTEGAGHEGFASFGGFFPLFQTPGENVTFLDGRVSVDTDGDFGGSLQAGHRTLLNDHTIWGAYAGIDVRDTGNRTFTQADVGTELLGEKWDLILNANLPLGDTRQVVSSNRQAVNPRFVQNQLILDEQRVDQIQAALTTVSLDAGLQLFDWGTETELWGRGGVYYLGGAASQESLGLRASLDYRLNNNLRFGLGVQNDGVFGTNAIFSVNASLGNSNRYSSGAEVSDTEASSANVWARAGEPIARTNTVLVEHQAEVAIAQEIAAINPETDRAFFFQHVAPDVRAAIDAGLVDADGTFEAPLNTIADAANIATANADNIIYVQEGDAGGDFTLPDGVQVRSVGPTQLLNTQFGVVTLPGSGSGNLPTVDGTATIGNNALVSGLAIDAAGGDAIFASGSGIAIEDNTITNARRGINLRESGGDVTIVRNQISNIARDGIFFNNLDETAETTITVANNTLADITGDGIEFKIIEENTANITVANNQITNTQKDSIVFDDIQGTAVANIDVSGNVINDAGSDGIRFDFIRGNADTTMNVRNNQISNVGAEGIFFNDIEENATAAITVIGNTITNAGDDGIEFDRIENNANVTATVTDNTITNPGDDGVRINHRADTDFCLALNNNTVTTPGSDGFEFISRGAGEFQVLNLNNVTTANVGTFNPADIADNATFVEGAEGVALCP